MVQKFMRVNLSPFRTPHEPSLFQDLIQRPRVKDLFLNAAIEGLIGGISLPLRKIPLRVSAVWGVIGLGKSTEPDPAAVLNFAPFVNGMEYFTDSCLGWGVAGFTFGILAYAVSVMRNKDHRY